MTSKSKKQPSDQNSDNEPVDPPGQAHEQMPEVPAAAEPRNFFVEESDVIRFEPVELDPLEDSPIGDESEKQDSDQNLDNEPVDPPGQENENVPEQPNEPSAIGSLRTLVSSQAMYLQGDPTDDDGQYDYAEYDPEAEANKDKMIDDVLGKGDPDPNQEGYIFLEDGDASDKSGLRPEESPPKDNGVRNKVLGGAALLVIIAALILLFNGGSLTPSPTQLPVVIVLPINSSTPTSTATPVVTMTPTATLTPSPTATPAGPLTLTFTKNAFCRKGPAVSFSDVTAITAGKTVDILNVSEDGFWYYIYWEQFDAKCWVAANTGQVNGDLSDIEVWPGLLSLTDLRLMNLRLMNRQQQSQLQPISNPNPARPEPIPRSKSMPGLVGMYYELPGFGAE